MARPKSEDKRNAILAAATEVISEQGIGAPTSRIAKVAGVAEGTLFTYFESKDELLLESLREAFREIADNLAHAAERSRPEAAWKAIVKAYLSLEYCDHAERGCPLPALAPEMARVDKSMRGQIFTELVKYKDRMVPFMPGRRTADKERAFFSIFSTMIGAIEIARMLPESAVQEKVLASVRDFLLHSF